MTTGRINQVSAYHQRPARCEINNNLSSRRRHLHKGFVVDDEPGIGTETSAPMRGLPFQRQRQATKFSKCKLQRPILAWKASANAAVFTNPKLPNRCKHTSWIQKPIDTSNNAQTPRQHVQTTECSVPAGAAQSTPPFNLEQLSCLQPQ